MPTYPTLDRQSFQALWANTRALAANGYGVKSGCDVVIKNGTLGSNEATITAQSGTVRVDGAEESVSATDLDVPASDDLPRKDLVLYDPDADAGAGAPVVVTGEPEAADPENATRLSARRPAPLDLSADIDNLGTSDSPRVPLAEIWVAGGVTGIDSADLFDRRFPADVDTDPFADERIPGSWTFDPGLTAEGTAVINQGSDALHLKEAGLDHVFLEFYAESANPDTRSGFIGYGSGTSTTLSVQNGYGSLVEITGSDLNVSSGAVQVGGNTVASSVVASGNVQLSSGSAVIDTGIADSNQPDATFQVALGADTQDAKVGARVFVDSADGNHKVEIRESGTSVDNPYVDYDIIQVR